MPPVMFSVVTKYHKGRHSLFLYNSEIFYAFTQDILRSLSTAMFFVILLIKDSSVDFLTYYALIAAPHVISAYFSTSRRAHF